MARPALIKHWVYPSGQWEKCPDHSLAYTGSKIIQFPHGVAITDVIMRSGFIRGSVSMADVSNSAAAFVFGYKVHDRSYFSSGLGGYTGAYDIQQFIPSKQAWIGLEVIGEKNSLESKKAYDLKLEIIGGQRVRTYVDEVLVIQKDFDAPIIGQLGLYAWGDKEVLFKDIHVVPATPKLFVIISFSDEYDAFFKDVIQPLEKSLKRGKTFEQDVYVYRVKDVKKPGQIYDDIIKGIIEADAVIAEVTPCNENIFYELGYSHAINKPTVLLKHRDRKLPFDIYNYRCIDYDENTSADNIQRQLKDYLINAIETSK